LSAARLLYERAAAAGSARAARLAARSYDNAFLASSDNKRADRDTAVAWYRRAAALGDAESAERLRQLGDSR
jgi:TPR repeat protein